MGITVDSNYVIDLLQLDRGAVAKAGELDRRSDVKTLSTPVLYEISAGLIFSRSRSEAAAFRAIASRFQILPFDEKAAAKAAEIRAELMRLGRSKGNVDVMIAGIAAAEGHVLVTRDQDFEDIAETAGFRLETY